LLKNIYLYYFIRKKVLFFLKKLLKTFGSLLENIYFCTRFERRAYFLVTGYKLRVTRNIFKKVTAKRCLGFIFVQCCMGDPVCLPGKVEKKVQKNPQKFGIYNKRYYLCRPFAPICAFWWSDFGLTA